MPAPVPPSWQAAFVVTTFALGDTLGDARATLDATDWDGAARVVLGLQHPDRSVRARTLASGLGQIAADVELARLA